MQHYRYFLKMNVFATLLLQHYRYFLMTTTISQVSKSGSVKVEKLMNIERYSHVMHISSTVRLFFFCITNVLMIYQILYFGNL